VLHEWYGATWFLEKCKCTGVHALYRDTVYRNGTGVLDTAVVHGYRRRTGGYRSSTAGQVYKSCTGAQV
jgi:hypothetical protein